jgi:phosphoglycolate phosphatase
LWRALKKLLVGEGAQVSIKRDGVNDRGLSAARAWGMHGQRVRAIILDLDGTLIDTLGDFIAAAHALCADLGRPCVHPERIATYIGQGMSVFVRRVLADDLHAAVAPDVHEAAMAAFSAHYERENGRSARLYPGVRESMLYWKSCGLPLACVTNKPQAFAQALLAQMGLLEALALVVGGDVLPQKKPHPEPLLHAARMLGVQPREGVVVGDSMNDVLAARAAGMRIWAVSYGYNEGRPIQSHEVDAIVDSLPEAVSHLHALA